VRFLPETLFEPVVHRVLALQHDPEGATETGSAVKPTRAVPLRGAWIPPFLTRDSASAPGPC